MMSKLYSFYIDSYILKILTGTVVIILSSNWILRTFKKYKSKKMLKKKIAEVENRKVQLFRKLHGMKIPLENIPKFCSLSGVEITHKINSCEVTAVDVFEAFQANALTNTQEFNFIADVIYDADVAALMVNPKDDKRLLGWPVSVKDALPIQKYDCTFGLPSMINAPADSDCVAVEALRHAGAIPFIISNVCQGLMTFETNNPIFGTTTNPLNPKLTCGGSSGGEAAALAAQSSVAGIGTDIGGSIRVPASFCGVFGFKPSSGRVSQRRTKKYCPGQNIIKDAIGPMARNMDDLVAVFRALVNDDVFRMDPLMPPLPFNEKLFGSDHPLRIGFYTAINWTDECPVPAVVRAVLLAKQALEQAGHEVVEFSLPELTDKALCQRIIFADGGRGLLGALNHDRVDSNIKSLVNLLRLPNVIKVAMGAIGGLFSQRIGRTMSAFLGCSTAEFMRLATIVDDYRETVLSAIEAERLDGLICPVMPMVCFQLGAPCVLNQSSFYPEIFNILDYSAGTVPVTHVTSDDLAQINESYSTDSYHSYEIAKSQANTLNMPVGVQCVSLPWKEEICLRIMGDVADNL